MAITLKNELGLKLTNANKLKRVHLIDKKGRVWLLTAKQSDFNNSVKTVCVKHNLKIVDSIVSKNALKNIERLQNAQTHLLDCYNYKHVANATNLTIGEYTQMYTASVASAITQTALYSI